MEPQRGETANPAIPLPYRHHGEKHEDKGIRRRQNMEERMLEKIDRIVEAAERSN